MLAIRRTVSLAALSLVASAAALAPAMVSCGDSTGGGGKGGGSQSTSSAAGHASSVGGESHGNGGSTSTRTSTDSSAGGSGGSTSSSLTTGSGGSGRTYHTSFPLTENPLSENGAWINGMTTGLDWHDCSSTPGLAIGHQQDTSYTDGTALLTGPWGPTQTVTATVHSVNPKADCYQEIEMRLRSAMGPHTCSGYEITFKASQGSDAYLIIVRWNGPVGDFTYLLNVSGTEYGVTEGDVVKATIVGNLITAFKNGVEMGHATDDTFTEGAPGMGFNLETADAACRGTNGDYGFTELTARAE